MKTCLLLLVATTTFAGTFFRIEIGPPVAAGTTFKVKGAAFAARAPSFTPPHGRWLIVMSGTCPMPKAAASTIVPMEDGTYIRDKVQVLREPASAKQVDAALATLVRAES